MWVSRSLSVAGLALTLGLGVAQAVPLPPGPVAVQVTDGDSLRIGDIRVRLHGIDAPELAQTCDRTQGGTWPCGRWSRSRLADLVQGQRLDCTDLGADRYGRRLVRCTLGGQDIAAQMVAMGAAMAYRRFSDDYVAQEAAARATGLGIWATGPQVAPEAYRHAARPAAQPVPASGCTIKGNIGNSGRIYHMPGQRDYASTRISEAKGEAWFCSAAEAQAAGFRPAQR